MPIECPGCSHTRQKITELIYHYQELLRTKEQEIECSHRIIAQLEQELKDCRLSLSLTGIHTNEVERSKARLVIQQQETIEYLKNRELRLLEKLKGTEKELFRLGIHAQDNQDIIKEFDVRDQENMTFMTPRKNTGDIGNHFVKERETFTLDRLFQESSIAPHNNSESKEGIRLKVLEDKLQLMNIKYKMALLKSVEIATIR